MKKYDHKIYNFVCQYIIDYDTHPHAERLLKTIINSSRSLAPFDWWYYQYQADPNDSDPST